VPATVSISVEVTVVTGSVVVLVVVTGLVTV
jgi:hypothetical protein